MKARYAWRTIQPTVANGSDRTLIFNGNSRRVMLALSTSSFGVSISNNPGSSPTGVFAFEGSAFMFRLPFGDYGPAMQGEIWISHGAAAPIVVICTEVYFLTRC